MDKIDKVLITFKVFCVTTAALLIALGVLMEVL